MQKIGLFFGSFNPIHIGHMIVANIMANHTDLDKVWFIVSPQNPLKSGANLLHEFDRYDMVKAAIADNYKLVVSDVEFQLPKPSYTSFTLANLSEKFPDNRFKLIIGEDNLEQFPRWKNYQSILDQFGLYVYPRPNALFSELKNHTHVTMVEAPMLDISATFIRSCVKNKRSIQYLVPEAVEVMIRTKGFYL